MLLQFELYGNSENCDANWRRRRVAFKVKAALYSICFKNKKNFYLKTRTFSTSIWLHTFSYSSVNIYTQTWKTTGNRANHTSFTMNFTQLESEPSRNYWQLFRQNVHMINFNKAVFPHKHLDDFQRIRLEHFPQLCFFTCSPQQETVCFRCICTTRTCLHGAQRPLLGS